MDTLIENRYLRSNIYKKRNKISAINQNIKIKGILLVYVQKWSMGEVVQTHFSVRVLTTALHLSVTMSALAIPISKDDFEQAISELPDDALFTVKLELETALLKLSETNDLLQAELPEANADDRVIYTEAIEENLPVIKGKNERLEILKFEMKVRGLLK